MEHLSIFNSDFNNMLAITANRSDRPEYAPCEGNFFPRALLLLVFSVVFALGMSHLVGRVYWPQPLSPAPEMVRGSEKFWLIFGNSRFEAGINSDLLAATLSQSLGVKVKAQMYSGGGWDSIHYYMLALLSRDRLRSGRDGVIIEVSPFSLNDAETDNRINAVRPEVALTLADVPGEPIEDRLKILVGAVGGLYRYRQQIQGLMLYPRLRGWLMRVGVQLEKTGLVKTVRSRIPFQLVFAPGREFVVQDILGDRAALRASDRQNLAKRIPSLRFGGYKFRALERAVRTFRSQGIDVYLVQTPTSHWSNTHLRRTVADTSFRTAIARLAKTTGAVPLIDWPSIYYDEQRFWDETHMAAGATDTFTSVLAKQLLTPADSSEQTGLLLSP